MYIEPALFFDTVLELPNIPSFFFFKRTYLPTLFAHTPYNILGCAHIQTSYSNKHVHTFGCNSIHHTFALVILGSLIFSHLLHLSLALGLNGRGNRGCTWCVQRFRLKCSTEWALGHTRFDIRALMAIGVGSMIETLFRKKNSYKNL